MEDDINDCYQTELVGEGHRSWRPAKAAAAAAHEELGDPQVCKHADLSQVDEERKDAGCLEIRSMRNGEADAVPLCFVYPRSLPSHGRRGAPPAGDPKAGGEGTAGGRLNEGRRALDTFLASGPTVCVRYCVRPFNGYRRGSMRVS